jgi:hypothetical protein
MPRARSVGPLPINPIGKRATVFPVPGATERGSGASPVLFNSTGVAWGRDDSRDVAIPDRASFNPGPVSPSARISPDSRIRAHDLAKTWRDSAVTSRAVRRFSTDAARTSPRSGGCGGPFIAAPSRGPCRKEVGGSARRRTPGRRTPSAREAPRAFLVRKGIEPRCSGTVAERSQGKSRATALASAMRLATTAARCVAASGSGIMGGSEAGRSAEPGRSATIVALPTSRVRGAKWRTRYPGHAPTARGPCLRSSSWTGLTPV